MESTPPKYNSLPPHSPSSSWKWIFLAMGTLFVVLPSIQNYLALRPMLEMLDFIPLSYYIQEMLPTFFLANASILASIGLFVGGILLMLGNRWGYILLVGCSAFMLVSILESAIIFGIVVAVSGTGATGLYISELFSILGVFPIFVILLEIAALVVLNLSGARHHLGVVRRTVFGAVSIAVLLFLDMNFCLLISYLKSM